MSGQRLMSRFPLLRAMLLTASLLLPCTAAWSSRFPVGTPLLHGRPAWTLSERRLSYAAYTRLPPVPRSSSTMSVQATRAAVEEPLLVVGGYNNSIDEASAVVLESSISTNNNDINNMDAIMDAETKALAQKILNAVFLAACFGWAAYTIFNIDDGMTRGWTQGEIAMRIPLDNWSNYERSLQDKPVFTKTLINVVIYLLGDWLSQTVFQKKNVLDFDVSRTLKNGFIGLCFGPLVHEYYQFSDTILPVEGGLMNRVEKIIMDQTIYLSIKCSIYIFAVGVLSGDSVETATTTVKDKIGGVVLTAWKFWPLVHCVTYGLIPARHRILWVNSVDLIWNAILASKAQKGDAEMEAIDNEEIKESALLAMAKEVPVSDDPLVQVAVPTELARVKETIEERQVSSHSIESDDQPPVVQEVSLTGSSIKILDDGVPVLVAADEEQTIVPIEEPAEEGIDIPFSGETKETSTVAP